MTFNFTDDGRVQVLDAPVLLDAEDFDFSDSSVSTWFHSEAEQFDGSHYAVNSRNSDYYRA